MALFRSPRGNGVLLKTAAVDLSISETRDPGPGISSENAKSLPSPVPVSSVGPRGVAKGPMSESLRVEVLIEPRPFDGEEKVASVTKSVHRYRECWRKTPYRT